MGQILTLKLNLTLKVKVNSPIKHKKVFYTSDPNLVILAWTGDKLVHRQAHDYITHGLMDTQTDAGKDNIYGGQTGLA